MERRLHDLLLMLRRTPLFYLGSNWISLIGVILVTTAGLLWLMLLPSWWRDEMANPYLGMLSNMALPILFIAGLLLIPLGIWWTHRARIAAGEVGPLIPRGGELRKLGIFLALTSFVNVVIGSQLMSSAVAYMDGDQFCGQACHTVMQPEYVAYKRSPHARVMCTECHIGSGAPWFVKAKLSGTRQLFAVLLHTYQTPISSPVYALRPARDICERCHWPQRFSGDMFLVRSHFAEDEANTASTTVALMKVGGQRRKGTVGIHGAHTDAQAKMQYISTDGRRQVIPEVTYTDRNGNVTVYKSTETKVTPQQLEAGEHRTMDCIDCHNRPTHIFELPENSVDKAMQNGLIAGDLPFIKKQAVAVLKVDYKTQDEGANQIAAKLNQFYADKYPKADGAKVKEAVTSVQTIYRSNIFPDMKVTWGVHPNNIGHMDTPGCFRCHDGNHSTADGKKTISNDCATCHDLLATEEKDPKVLKNLGVAGSLIGEGGGH